MKTRKVRLGGLLLTLFVTFLTVVGIVWADDPARGLSQRQRFDWVITKRLNVSNLAIFSGDVEVAGDVTFDGDMTMEEDLTVSGTLDVRGDVFDGAGHLHINDPISITGDVDIDGNLVVTGTSDLLGDVTLENGETIVNSLNNVITVTATTVDVVGSLDVEGGTLELEDVAFSGPITFGSDALTSDAEWIAHGLATTPTAVVLTPITSTQLMSCCVAISATNTISFNVGVSPLCSGAIGVYWFAGK